MPILSHVRQWTSVSAGIIMDRKTGKGAIALDHGRHRHALFYVGSGMRFRAAAWTGFTSPGLDLLVLHIRNGEDQTPPRLLGQREQLPAAPHAGRMEEPFTGAQALHAASPTSVARAWRAWSRNSLGYRPSFETRTNSRRHFPACSGDHGRHSNVILVRSDGRIVDSVKRVPPSMSHVQAAGPARPGMRCLRRTSSTRHPLGRDFTLLLASRAAARTNTCRRG